MMPEGGVSSAHLPAGAAGRLTFNHVLRTAALPTGWRGNARAARLAWRRVTRPVAYLCMAAWLTCRYGPAVAGECGVSVALQIRHQLQLMFCDGINPKVYYFLDLYRTWSPTVGQQCVMRREIKSGLLMALHRLRPKLSGRRVSLGRKLEYSDHCRRHGLPTPRILAVGKKGALEWRMPAEEAGTVDLFLKPELSRGARGAFWFKRVGSASYRAIGGRRMSLAAVLELAARRSVTKDQLLQEALQNHPCLSGLARDSLIVFRVFTCIDEAGQPVVTHAMLRVLSKLEPAWRRKDEYAAAVDLVTGVLGPMCGDTSYGPSDWTDWHPITGARVTGRQIERWGDICETALAGHRAFTDRILLGWDVALTIDGPVLIEANAYPDTEFLQRAHRQPIGLSPLGRLLSHHIARLSTRTVPGTDGRVAINGGATLSAEGR
jgi:hypothetical protein